MVFEHALKKKFGRFLQYLFRSFFLAFFLSLSFLYFISFCYPTFSLGFYGIISHFPQVYPLVPGLKLLEEDEIAKFLTKTEQKNWKRIRKKKCSMDLVIVGVW